MSRETLIVVAVVVAVVATALALVLVSPKAKCRIVGWIGTMPIQQCEEVPPELREIGPDRAGKGGAR